MRQEPAGGLEERRERRNRGEERNSRRCVTSSLKLGEKSDEVNWSVQHVDRSIGVSLRCALPPAVSSSTLLKPAVPALPSTCTTDMWLLYDLLFSYNTAWLLRDSMSLTLPVCVCPLPGSGVV